MLEIICEHCLQSFDTEHLPRDIDDEGVCKDAQKAGWKLHLPTICPNCKG